jgi:MFS family permease
VLLVAWEPAVTVIVVASDGRALSLAGAIAAALGLTALLASVVQGCVLGRRGERPVAVAESAGWGTLALLVTYSVIMAVTSPPSAPSSQEAAVGDVFLALPLFVALVALVGVGMGLQHVAARVKGRSPQRSGSA